MGIYSSVKAELKAVYCSLGLAKERGIDQLWVKLDSMVAVGFIKRSFQMTLEHSSLIKQCWELISDPECEVLISHCYREGNNIADWLTNLEVDLNT